MNGNMVTQVNPGITENEMRSFFDRLVNAMVERTKLASDVEELKVKLDETLTRVTSLVAEASNLRNNVYTLQGERDQARRESEDNKKLADMFSADLERTKASEAQVRTDLVETRNNFYQAKAELEQRSTEVNNLTRALETTSKDRDWWCERAGTLNVECHKVTKELTETRSKLTKFQEFYKGMFAEVEPVEVPGTAPKFTDPVKEPEGTSDRTFPLYPVETSPVLENTQSGSGDSQPKQEETHPTSSEVTDPWTPAKSQF